MPAGIAPVGSRANIALCHTETVYGTDGDCTGHPAFKSPPEIAQALADTGHDGCSTASNHTLDDGAAGIHRTLDALDRAGVSHSGSARTAQEAGGHAAARRGCRGRAPLLHLWHQRLPASCRAGADAMAVSLHWGTEWQPGHPRPLHLLPSAREGDRWEVTRAEFVPQGYDLGTGRVVNLNEALARGADVGAVRDRIRDVVLSRGAAQDGLTMGR